MKKDAIIYISGTVQGVGFRPFIYRTAKKYGLKGYVINLGDAGVEVRAEGEEKVIKLFMDDVRTNAPAVSEIKKVKILWRAYRHLFNDFHIKKSKKKQITYESVIPPDFSICDECINDVLTSGSRWYHYPFTCCSHCGPRFTSVYEPPYDRNRTNMQDFPLCEDCLREFENPLDRRFHAQGICCPRCGPTMTLYTSNGVALSVNDPIEEAVKLIDGGYIVAIKGIGGIHLATKTTEDGPLRKLRHRKKRPNQPFAIMSPNIKAIKTFAQVTKIEEKLLTSWQKPIVILEKSQQYYLSDLVAPGINTVGVMLPYTGIHLMLFQYTDEPALVMTSGNKPGLPMAITNELALKELEGIADYFLLHNRKIINRCDDSVIRVLNSDITFIRRSRGYVLAPIDLPTRNKRDITVIALGAELRNTGSILYKNRCYITQHIGDTNNLETLNYLDHALNRIQQLLTITSDSTVIACDLHPRYTTSRFAREKSQTLNCPLIPVQHHHAHLTSLMAENGISPDQPIIGVAMDGMGYGVDGTVWGGEVLKVTYNDFVRCGHLQQQPMPGGDLCTIYPPRMLIAILSSMIPSTVICDIIPKDIVGSLPQQQKELELILRRLKNPNVMVTSSTGRVLDAVSAALGICYKRTYEGEPAIRLEALAAKGDPSVVEIESEVSRKNRKYILNTSKILYDVIELSKNHKISDIAAAAQKAIAIGMAKIATMVASDEGIDIVGISGGVCVNKLILKVIREYVQNHGLHFIHHSKVPPGDGGIALGQAVTSLAKCDL